MDINIISDSGSPKRTLYSMVLIPPLVFIRPANKIPLKGLFSLIIALAVGFRTFSIASSISESVICFIGIQTPIPPVFKPWSLSKALLWSWTTFIGITISPDTKARRENSSPSRNSSITTDAPASANF